MGVIILFMIDDCFENMIILLEWVLEMLGRCKVGEVSFE